MVTYGFKINEMKQSNSKVGTQSTEKYLRGVIDKNAGIYGNKKTNLKFEWGLTIIGAIYVFMMIEEMQNIVLWIHF